MKAGASGVRRGGKKWRCVRTPVRASRRWRPSGWRAFTSFADELSSDDLCNITPAVQNCLRPPPLAAKARVSGSFQYPPYPELTQQLAMSEGLQATLAALNRLVAQIKAYMAAMPASDRYLAPVIDWHHPHDYDQTSIQGLTKFLHHVEKEQAIIESVSSGHSRVAPDLFRQSISSLPVLAIS